MLDFFKNIFRSGELKDSETRVASVNAFAPEFEKLTDEELKKRSGILRGKAQAGESLDELLPEAFALAREAAHRTLKQRPYDVQILGGMILHKGAVAEMMTGEGKTLAAVAPVYLNALQGQGAHVVTVNEYLARRDASWMGQVYHALGLSVSCLVPNGAYLYDPEWHVKKEEDLQKLDAERDLKGGFEVQQEFLRPISRREAYLADVTYGTNHEFGFDYLRDNLAYRLTDQVQRTPHFAIIDEVDSILIDEARTPLIISAPDVKSSDFYKTFARVVTNLSADLDFTVDEKHRSVSITSAGIEKVEKIVGLKNLYAPENLRLVHYLEESLRAKALFHKDKDYVVKDGEVIIVDEFTGRMLHGRRYNGGLHQAIEAKEGVLVKEESRTYAKISIQNYFRMYQKISGMTGTAQTSAEEFFKVYGLEVVSIPTHRPMIRKDNQDLIYKNADAKWRAVAGAIRERYDAGQPVLVGTTSIEKNEKLSALLRKEGVPHEILNAKNNEREGAIIAQAGRLKAVTVATNMAGRGVDIILGGNPPDAGEAGKVREAGGLHVIGTERHEARRIDNQLRGRAGRQGDPGSSQFYLSMEDDLLRIFGGDRVKAMMDRFDLPEDQPIQVGFVSKAVAQAQAKVEGAHFDMRKHLLEYDDVLNKQRSAVYRRRQEIMGAVHKGELATLIFDAAAGFLEKLLAQGEETAEFDLENAKKAFTESGVVANPEWPITDADNMEDVRTKLRALLTKRSVETSVHPQAPFQALGILDLLWMNHLEDLEALSESVGLRAYGQRDPLAEYRQESRRLFSGFWENFDGMIFSNLFKLKAETASAGAAKDVPEQTINLGSGGGAAAPEGRKVGRNDPCPCGAINPANGKVYKYKHCGLINAPHHKG